MVEQIDRWRGLTAATIMFAAGGLATGSSTLLFAAIIPVVYVAYSTLSTVSPVSHQLTVSREVRPSSPMPGQHITVSVELTNTGETPLTDVRVIDGVPEKLTVVDGAAEGAVSLRPGSSTTLEYTMLGKRGSHQFDDVAVRARSLSAGVLSTEQVTPEGTTAFECRVTMDDIPVQDQTMFYTGPLATDTGGEGVEFHKTRDYQTGDPINRIDWRRLAKTGELTTVEYREQESAKVVVVLDAREIARQAPAELYPAGATMCAYAGALAIDALEDAGHQVGVAGLGLEPPEPGVDHPAPAWVAPSTGRGFTGRAARVIDAATASEVAASSPLTGTPDTAAPEPAPSQSGASPNAGGSEATAADGGLGEIDRLLAQLPSDAQVLFCTPALDDHPADVVARLTAHGHQTTVLSPDVTGQRSAGQHLESMDRAHRLVELRTAGAPVVDWQYTDPLPMALAKALDPLLE